MLIACLRLHLVALIVFSGGIGLNATALLAAAGMHDIVSSVDGAMFWPQDPLRERCLALLLVLLHNRRYWTLSRFTAVLSWLAALRNVCCVDTVCYTPCVATVAPFTAEFYARIVLVTQLMLGAGAVISTSCKATEMCFFPYPVHASCSFLTYARGQRGHYRSVSVGAAARPNPFREAFGLLHDPTLHLLHRSASAKGDLVL
jgi:hypothetical protein